MPLLRSKTMSRAAAAAAASALLAASLAPQAQGHVTRSTHPEGSYAEMASNHLSIQVCDVDPDGNRAYIRITTGAGILDPFYDPDGAGGSCGVRPIGGPSFIDSYTVCVQNEGCGNPVYRGSF